MSDVRGAREEWLPFDWGDRRKWDGVYSIVRVCSGELMDYSTREC